MLINWKLLLNIYTGIYIYIYILKNVFIIKRLNIIDYTAQLIIIFSLATNLHVLQILLT